MRKPVGARAGRRLIEAAMRDGRRDVSVDDKPQLAGRLRPDNALQVEQDLQAIERLPPARD